MAAAESTFRVMGCIAHVLISGGEDMGGLLAAAEDRLTELERRWTRFSPDSELSRLNRRPGLPTSVHSDTFALVARACDGWRLTGGLFDPGVLPALVAAGYDRPLDERGRSGWPMAGDPGPAPGCAGIDLDAARCRVTLPPGVSLDPGGIGKGLAADIVAEELVLGGASGVLVNVGGDLRATGRPPNPAGWRTAIEDPADPTAILAVLRLEEGGLATSTPSHRKWVTPTGMPGAHVIDPRTGLPAATDVASVTVLAAHGWMAEVVAGAAAVVGVDPGVHLIDELGLSGVVVSDAGAVRLSARAGAFL